MTGNGVNGTLNIADAITSAPSTSTAWLLGPQVHLSHIPAMGPVVYPQRTVGDLDWTVRLIRCVGRCDLNSGDAMALPAANFKTMAKDLDDLSLVGNMLRLVDDKTSNSGRGCFR